ncbi:hypothetical protein [Botrimarina sp.]|uniref:hypothetical protein n=1 Tax=Botrimarina sp. TaxID=2795802 RepID=UPI0032EC57F3
MASDPIGDPRHLWAVLGGSGADPSLLRIDAAERRPIELIPIDVAISSLAINPVTGLMYGAKASTLYSIDPNAAELTAIGTTPVWVDEALGFDRAGVLYGTGASARGLVRVDLHTAATEIVNGAETLEAIDLAADPATGDWFASDIHGDLRRVVIAEDGTAVVSDLGRTRFNRGTGLAFAVVPEPSAILLTVLILAAVMGDRRPARGAAAARSQEAKCGQP